MGNYPTNRTIHCYEETIQQTIIQLVNESIESSNEAFLGNDFDNSRT